MIATVLSIFFMILGAVFMLIGNIGLIKLPDFYSRIHATGKIDTLAIFLLILGFIIYEGFTIVSTKLLFILIFTFITTPVATNALAGAAHHFRVRLKVNKDK